MNVRRLVGEWSRAGWREPYNAERRASECLARVQAEMDATGVDAILLFRDENVHYASGTRHVAGTPAVSFFFPIVAVVTRTGWPYIFTTDADGIPMWVDDTRVGGPIFVEEASGIEALAQRVRDILGDVSGKRIGIDLLNTHAWRLLPDLLRGAELVDGQEIMLKARRVKTDQELACMLVAEQATEAAAADVVRAIRPGVRGVELNRIFLSRLTELGLNWSAFEGVYCTIPSSHDDVPAASRESLPYRKLTTDVPFGEGELITVDVGALYDGYIADLGLTWWCGFDPPTSAHYELYAEWRQTIDAMLLAIKPGNTAADVHRAAGNNITSYVGHSLGHGVEPPLIGGDSIRLEDEEQDVIEPGMILVVEPYIWREGLGGFRAEHVVVVTDDGWEPITQFSLGPIARARG